MRLARKDGSVRYITLEDGAELVLDEAFVAPAESSWLFQGLVAEVPFAQRTIRVFGREAMQPRLVAWMGEPEAVYTYSGTTHQPLPLGPLLTQLRSRVAERARAVFNSVLCNLYRDGNDAMGMHSDSEPELGPAPVIASLSLGATRRFTLRHRDKTKGGLDLQLADGSLLIMRGTTQRFYRHGIPRERRVQTPRLNLTFRNVQPRWLAEGR